MRLKERVTFVSPVVTAESSGGFNNSGYEDVYTCWADVTFDSSQKDYSNFQYMNQTQVTVRIRYNSGFAPTITNKIVWKEKLLTIHSSPDLGAKDYIKLRCFYDPNQTYESGS
jgi:head-tail adaptor